ncbi:MAG TPA: Crp/Fnr family transcriptional regulator [Tepidisphaeraceae bacterium]|jgi:CRP/FNR family transcriptional regulator
MTAMVDPAMVLGRHPFFASLDANGLREVGRHVVVRAYAKNSLVYLEGEPAPGLYVVASGRIRVYKGSDNAREQELFQATAGESINEASAFDAGPTIANAQATELSMVLLIRREALAELMRQYPEIAATVVALFSARVRELAKLAGDLSLLPVVARIASVVLRLAGQREMASLPTRSDLAAMVGTVREVATRALRQLEIAGAIRLERGAAVILDREKLQELSHARWPPLT